MQWRQVEINAHIRRSDLQGHNYMQYALVPWTPCHARSHYMVVWHVTHHQVPLMDPWRYGCWPSCQVVRTSSKERINWDILEQENSLWINWWSCWIGCSHSQGGRHPRGMLGVHPHPSLSYHCQVSFSPYKQISSKSTKMVLWPTQLGHFHTPPQPQSDKACRPRRGGWHLSGTWKHSHCGLEVRWTWQMDLACHSAQFPATTEWNHWNMLCQWCCSSETCVFLPVCAYMCTYTHLVSNVPKFRWFWSISNEPLEPRHDF